MMLAPGTRAVAVKVNEVIGVSGFIAPNDRVDVIANIEKPGTEGLDKNVAKVVLQDKRVLSVAQTIEKTKDGKPKVASSITLELTPDETEKLSFATTKGQVVLALRGANDRGTAETKGSTVADFLPKQVAAKSPRKPYEVNVYNGSQRSVVTF
jgi:pilus assembly protein CpaB